MLKIKKNSKKITLLLFIFVIFSSIFCGCALNVTPNVTGAVNVDMTPRLISLGGEMSTAQVVKNVKSAIVGIKSTLSNGYSVGSGVAIKEGGYILTNQHVIASSKSLTVYFADKSTASATLIWQDSSVDLAVIKSSKDMPYLECENSVEVGEDVIAIGTPLSLAFQHTVTKGIVSAMNRTLEVQSSGGYTSYMQNLIQHDASINPGNSGGPLINLRGRVVGINTLKANDAEGIGFAIPIATGESIVSRLSVNNGYTPPYMGVIGVSAEYARAKDFSVNSDGLYILGVDKTSTAGLLGILPGDVIVKIDNTPISDFLDLRKVLYSHEVGDKVTVHLIRENTPMEITLTLGERNF